MANRTVYHPLPQEVIDAKAGPYCELPADDQEVQCSVSEVMWEVDHFLEIIAEIWSNPASSGNEPSEEHRDTKNQ